MTLQVKGNVEKTFEEFHYSSSIYSKGTIGSRKDVTKNIVRIKQSKKELLKDFPSAARPSCRSKTRRFPSPPHGGFGFIVVFSIPNGPD
jgi:hypothetical protein